MADVRMLRPNLVHLIMIVLLLSAAVNCHTSSTPVARSGVLRGSKSRPVIVEPEFKRTFGDSSAVPSGTTFHIRIVRTAVADQIRLHRCDVPCSSAPTIVIWEPGSYRVGDELIWTVDRSGRYYLWSENTATDSASVVVSEEVVNGARRMSFDSGAQYEAWYVLP